MPAYAGGWRVGVDESSGGETRATPLALSETLPDDLQGVFLMVARAATVILQAWRFVGLHFV